MDSYIVVIGERKGKRYAKRLPLNVSLALATGRYERMSDRALNDTVTDLTNEQLRRFMS